MTLTIGLTGGIGSGKSTVAALFSEHGVPCIDADDISHAVTQPGQTGYEGIIKLFGPTVVAEDGQLKRKQIRQIVFADPELRKQLEALIHPLVRSGIKQFQQQTDYHYCIITIPLLLEAGETNYIDRILVVDLPEDLQIIRAGGRDNATKAEIASIMQAQISREQRLAKADDVIHNTKDTDFLRQQVEKLHRKYLGLSEATEG
ncbi:MAG: dephospho-CoA kinase [Gammaproteobacteria bacterium]